MGVLRAGLLEPVAIEAHEVTKAARVRIPRVLHERCEPHGQCFGQARLAGRIESAGYEQRAGVVVDAIAVGAIRYGVYRMLEQSSLVAHREQVPELHLRRSRTVMLDHGLGARRYDSESLLAPNPFEGGKVALRRSLPGHRAAAEVSAPAHALSPRVVGEQARDGCTDCRRISKRHQDAALVRKQLARVPV